MTKGNNPGTNTTEGTNTWSKLSKSQSILLEGLLQGSKWGNTSPDNGTTSLSYYLHDYEWITGKPLNGAWRFSYNIDMSSGLIIPVTKAMEAFENVANIKFNQITNLDDANVSWAISDNDGFVGINYSGIGIYPVPNDPESLPFKDLTGLIAINKDDLVTYWGSGLTTLGNRAPKGSYDFSSLFMHELGHALGLKHPHDELSGNKKFPGVTTSSDLGENQLNAEPWTLMGYNSINSSYTPSSRAREGFLYTPGALDIAALHYLYGANETKNINDNTYKLNSSLLGYQCIWDNGGHDTIDASTATKDCVIELRNATLGNESGGGGYLSRYGSNYIGYTIAYNSTGNCIIEDAKGGTGADKITGNKYTNNIQGNAGNDTIDGGNGYDIATYSGNFSNYTFSITNKIVTVTDNRSSTNDGIDTLSNIEKLTFNDKSALFTNNKIKAIDSLGFQAEKVYQGKSEAYKFYNLGSDKYGVGTTNGIDELTGASLLKFDDKNLHLVNDIKATFDQVTGLNNSTGEMFRLYNAAFARFPDSSGLRYWINQYSSGKDDARAVASSFLVSDEFSERYGANVTNAKYVETLYVNVLGRDYDQDGYNYWLGNLNSGKETRYELLLGFAESAENKALFTEMTGLG